MKNYLTSFALVFALIPISYTHSQTGHTLNGSGARSFGMAGVGTAYAINPGTALLWNQAAITNIPTSIELSASVISLNAGNYSELDFSVLDPNLQGFALADELNDQTKNTILPVASFVYNPNSKWSFGLTAAGIGGFGVDYPTNSSSPLSVLFGDIKSKYRLFQVSVAVAYEINEKLSLAIAPAINFASLEFAPITTTAPALVDGQPVYPSGDKASATGYGFHLSLMYRPTEDVTFGVMYKSKQEFELFEYSRLNGLGQKASTDLDYPRILSTGVAYTGLSNTVIAFDFRFINFSSTDGFAESGYHTDLSAKGFGWNDAYFYGLGIEHTISDPLKIRVGYSYNTSPVQESTSFFSVAAPAIINHAVGLGGTYSISEKIDLSLGFHHGFEESISGPIILPSDNGGLTIPSQVQSSLSSNVFSMDITYRL